MGCSAGVEWPAEPEHTVKFGVTLTRVHHRSATAVAKHAEALGYESIWTGEHLIWPTEYAPHFPYASVGRPGVSPDIPTMDPWVLLTAIASVTSRIRVGTSVYILPLRDPLVTARAAMSLDVFSGGRFSFGVGAGWLAEEFTYAGLDYMTRGRRMDECIAVLNALWLQYTPEHRGEFFNIGPVKFEPKPIQQPRPPLLVGGDSAPALRRAARLGDGWLGLYRNVEDAARALQQLVGYRQRFQREHEPFEVVLQSGGEPTLDEILRLEELGVTRLIVSPFTRTREAQAGLERFAETVMPRVPVG